MEQTNEQNRLTTTGPHLTLFQKEHHIIEDAKALIVHHLRRQSHLQKDEKTKVKLFLNGFLQDFFFAPRGLLMYWLPFPLIYKYSYILYYIYIIYMLYHNILLCVPRQFYPYLYSCIIDRTSGEH